MLLESGVAAEQALAADAPLRCLLSTLSERAAEAQRYALSSMNPIEQIDSHEYLYLTEIGEPEVTVLRIVIEEAKASQGETRTLEVASAKISELRPIVADDSCQRYEIVFGSYVAYCVRNESYVVMDQSEVFTGRLFNVYSQSHLLDYVRAATIASEDYPGRFIHYGINCLDHILDVVSIDEPAINILAPRITSGWSGPPIS